MHQQPTLPSDSSRSGQPNSRPALDTCMRCRVHTESSTRQLQPYSNELDHWKIVEENNKKIEKISPGFDHCAILTTRDRDLGPNGPLYRTAIDTGNSKDVRLRKGATVHERIGMLSSFAYEDDSGRSKPGSVHIRHTCSSS